MTRWVGKSYTEDHETGIIWTRLDDDEPIPSGYTVEASPADVNRLEEEARTGPWIEIPKDDPRYRLYFEE